LPIVLDSESEDTRFCQILIFDYRICQMWYLTLGVGIVCILKHS